MTVMKEIIYLR